tara:strand:+ start:75 stop:371 length:297 start_codon:yes stop_codon:yes gene_type:complete
MSKEEIKRIILEGNVKDDGRIYLNFKYFQEDKRMSDLELVGLLTASLSMSIKSAITNMDYETQGRFLKDVMGKIESEFFDIEAFKDLNKKQKSKSIKL